jgi:arylsulfatase A-like enzyme
VEHRGDDELVSERVQSVIDYHLGRTGPLSWQRPRDGDGNHASPTTRANIVLILFDDAGYGDLGANHDDRYDRHDRHDDHHDNHDNHHHHHHHHGPALASHTPYLDDLSRRGGALRLTSFYVTHSICCPSRASIMTGRLGVRTGIFGHLPPWASAGLPASELTVASLLRGHGYRTIALGKWHLGHQPPHEPLSHGFDEWIGLPFSNE